MGVTAGCLKRGTTMTAHQLERTKKMTVEFSLKLGRNETKLRQYCDSAPTYVRR